MHVFAVAKNIYKKETSTRTFVNERNFVEIKGFYFQALEREYKKTEADTKMPDI